MFKEGGWNWFKRDKTDEGEKTKRIPGGGDGVNLEQHPFADEKAEQQPYKHTDKPVMVKEGYKAVEDIESHYSGTGNPEDIMIAEEEEKAKDPYAMYNAQGDTRPPQREVTFGDYEEDEKYFDKIADMGVKINDNKDKFSLTGDKEEKFKTPTEIRVETKAKIGDSKRENYKIYKNSKRNFGRKPKKDIRTDDKKILGK